MDREEWVSLAKEALVEMVDVEHAVVGMEARAKACDNPWDDYPTFDPDILNAARDGLLATGQLRQTPRLTKGGRRIPVLHLPDLAGRETSFQKAAARKSALQTRYIGWTRGNKRNPEGQIGPAAEAVARESLHAARDSGYLLINDGRTVGNLLGAPVKGGPLDAAAYLVTEEQDLPVTIVLVIEVKNIRGWIYPNSQELNQLLYKAASLQEAHPEQDIMPLLVCRRLHWTAGKMAKELGFFLVALWAQYIRPQVPNRLVDEVRDTLGYVDLTRRIKADGDLVHRLRETVPTYAPAVSRRWAEFGASFTQHYEKLRKDIDDRAETMSNLYEAVRDAPGWSETWPLRVEHLGMT